MIRSIYHHHIKYIIIILSYHKMINIHTSASLSCTYICYALITQRELNVFLHFSTRDLSYVMITTSRLLPHVYFHCQFKILLHMYRHVDIPPQVFISHGWDVSLNGMACLIRRDGSLFCSNVR